MTNLRFIILELLFDPRKESSIAKVVSPSYFATMQVDLEPTKPLLNEGKF